jgi:hypothetical protein
VKQELIDQKIINTALIEEITLLRTSESDRIKGTIERLSNAGDLEKATELHNIIEDLERFNYAITMENILDFMTEKKIAQNDLLQERITQVEASAAQKSNKLLQLLVANKVITAEAAEGIAASTASTEERLPPPACDDASVISIESSASGDPNPARDFDPAEFNSLLEGSDAGNNREDQETAPPAASADLQASTHLSTQPTADNLALGINIGFEMINIGSDVGSTSSRDR